MAGLCVQGMRLSNHQGPSKRTGDGTTGREDSTASGVDLDDGVGAGRSHSSGSAGRSHWNANVGTAVDGPGRSRRLDAGAGGSRRISLTFRLLSLGSALDGDRGLGGLGLRLRRGCLGFRSGRCARDGSRCRGGNDDLLAARRSGLGLLLDSAPRLAGLGVAVPVRGRVAEAVTDGRELEALLPCRIDHELDEAVDGESVDVVSQADEGGASGAGAIDGT